VHVCFGCQQLLRQHLALICSAARHTIGCLVEEHGDALISCGNRLLSVGILSCSQVWLRYARAAVQARALLYSAIMAGTACGLADEFPASRTVCTQKVTDGESLKCWTASLGVIGVVV
jgi:hypothetical protein